MGVVLACLQDNDQVCEVIGLLTTSEEFRMVLLVEGIAKLLQNVENDLGFDAC